MVQHPANPLFVFHIHITTRYLGRCVASMAGETAYSRSLFNHWYYSLFQTDSFFSTAAELPVAALSAGAMELEQKESSGPQNTLVAATA